MYPSTSVIKSARLDIHGIPVCPSTKRTTPWSNPSDGLDYATTTAAVHLAQRSSTPAVAPVFYRHSYVRPDRGAGAAAPHRRRRNEYERTRVGRAATTVFSTVAVGDRSRCSYYAVVLFREPPPPRRTLMAAYTGGPDFCDVARGPLRASTQGGIDDDT